MLLHTANGGVSSWYFLKLCFVFLSIFYFTYPNTYCIEESVFAHNFTVFMILLKIVLKNTCYILQLWPLCLLPFNFIRSLFWHQKIVMQWWFYMHMVFWSSGRCRFWENLILFENVLNVLFSILLHFSNFSRYLI